MTTWNCNYAFVNDPERSYGLSMPLDTDNEQAAIRKLSKGIWESDPGNPFEIKSVTMQPIWFCDKLYEKLNALVHELDKVLLELNSTADFYETESREFKLKLLLERFDGITDTIEILYHTRFHFSRTDEYFGICDDEERYLIKVIRK